MSHHTPWMTTTPLPTVVCKASRANVGPGALPARFACTICSDRVLLLVVWLDQPSTHAAGDGPFKLCDACGRG